jgi:hypothetical protein
MNGETKRTFRSIVNPCNLLATFSQYKILVYQAREYQGNCSGNAYDNDALPGREVIQKHLILYATRTSDIRCLYIILYAGI